MSSVMARIRREPVIVVQLAAAIFSTCGSFGLHLSDVQQTQLIGLIWAVMLIAGFASRSQVVPAGDVLESTRNGKVIAGPANDRMPSGSEIRDLDESVEPPVTPRHAGG